MNTHIIIIRFFLNKVKICFIFNPVILDTYWLRCPTKNQTGHWRNFNSTIATDFNNTQRLLLIFTILKNN